MMRCGREMVAVKAHREKKGSRENNNGGESFLCFRYSGQQ